MTSGGEASARGAKDVAQGEVVLDIRLIRSFLMLHEAGTFTEAAQQLDISQPALSQQMRKLELQLGSPLIIRRSQGLVFTRVGLVLAAEGKGLLAHAYRVQRIVRRAFDCGGPSLSVAFDPSIPRRVIDSAFQVASEGGREVYLLRLEWGDDVGALLDGRADVVLMQDTAMGGIVPGDDVGSVVIGRQQRVALINTEHRLASRTEVSLADLSEERVLDASFNRDYWLPQPRPGGAEVRIAGPAPESPEALVALVSNGRGIAITSAAVGETYRRDDVVSVPIADLEPIVMVASTLTTASDEVGGFVGRLEKVLIRQDS